MGVGTWVASAQLAQFASPVVSFSVSLVAPAPKRRSSRDRDIPSRRAASDRLPPVAASIARAAARWISASVAGKGTGVAAAGATRAGSSSATAKLPAGDSRTARSSVLRSSRTLPGQECASKARRASGGRGGWGEPEGGGNFLKEETGGSHAACPRARRRGRAG